MLPEPDWSLIEEPLPTESSYQSKSQLAKRIKALTDELAMAKQVIKYRKGTEQANTAMLVIQDMTLQKMNETLHAKEKGKKPKHNQIFTGGKG
jgi:predicted component of type VI protein secretion system